MLLSGLTHLARRFARLGRGLSTAAAAATANWVQLPSLHPPRHDHALLPELSPCGGRIESVLAVGGSFGFGKTAGGFVYSVHSVHSVHSSVH